MPTLVRIAGGPSEGRYAEIAKGIALELQNRFNVRVEVIETRGSLENIQMLQAGNADLGLYQPGTLDILGNHGPDNAESEPATFVSNLYPEFLLPVVPAGFQGNTLDQMQQSRWSCNDRLSGDYAITCLLLKHLGLSEADVNVMSVDYPAIPAKLSDGSVDVSVLCCGIDAPILKTLFTKEIGKPVAIPALEAFAMKHPTLSADSIPAGYFQTTPPIPAENFPTLTLQAQLLASRDSSVRLVEEVTRILGDKQFQSRHGLNGLFSHGIDYAIDRPEFDLHLGASHIYFPELKPLLNPDFVEGTEGIRSFIVSFFAAAWLLQRWWTHRQIRRHEHKLDRYIKDLLQLERDQMDVDGEGGPEEGKVLQRLLDQITLLRQEALSEFTAHELNEDRAVDCYIQMCHALSDKINSKLLRSTLWRIQTKRPQP